MCMSVTYKSREKTVVSIKLTRKEGIISVDKQRSEFNVRILEELLVITKLLSDH
jgi:hypothetical protein